MYRSAASVGTARIAPDITVRMLSRALRVLRIVLSVGIQSARVWLKVSQIERGHAVIPLEGSLSVFVGRHGAMKPAGRVRIRNIMPIAIQISLRISTGRKSLRPVA